MDQLLFSALRWWLEKAIGNIQQDRVSYHFSKLNFCRDVRVASLGREQRLTDSSVNVYRALVIITPPCATQRRVSVKVVSTTPQVHFFLLKWKTRTP